MSWSVAVVIPAHDEAATITRCVKSVLHAASRTTGLQALWIVVAADACRDRTAQRAARALGPHGEVVTLHARSAREARRVGTQAALAHFAYIPREHLWVACTDADSQVRPDWLITQLAIANQGYQGLAGIVELLDGGDWEREVHTRHYPVHADGTHPHIHGATLAFRADAYLDAGGWRDLRLAEDHCLWQRLLERGWRLRSSTASVVQTSARLEGRAEGGFASTLKRRIDAEKNRPKECLAELPDGRLS